MNTEHTLNDGLPKHRRVLTDVSSWTTLIECSCGTRVLGVGEGRQSEDDATILWTAHAADRKRLTARVAKGDRQGARSLSQTVAGINPDYFVWQDPSGGASRPPRTSDADIVLRLRGGDTIAAVSASLHVDPKRVSRLRTAEGIAPQKRGPNRERAA